MATKKTADPAVEQAVKEIIEKQLAPPVRRERDRPRVVYKILYNGIPITGLYNRSIYKNYEEARGHVLGMHTAYLQNIWVPGYEFIETDGTICEGRTWGHNGTWNSFYYRKKGNIVVDGIERPDKTERITEKEYRSLKGKIQRAIDKVVTIQEYPIEIMVHEWLEEMNNHHHI